MRNLRLYAVLLILLLSVGVVAAVEEETVIIDDKPVFLLSAEVEAMGGANTSIAHGYEALFTNPAGLSRKGGELTFLSLNLGPYFLPTENMIDLGIGLVNGDDVSEYTDDLSALLDGLDLESGVGTNLNVGMGLSAFGLGLGFLTDADILITQEGSAFSLFVEPVITSSLAAGLSHGFSLGSSKLYLGGALRGIARIRPTSSISIDDIAALLGDESSAFDPETYQFGLSLGYGYDAGVILETEGGFTLGAVANNIGGTTFVTANQTVAGIEAAVNGSSDPQSLYDALVVDQLTGYTYVIPMSITAGIGYDAPDRGFTDFRLSADYTHTLYSDPELIEDDSIWKNIHLGAELSLLGMVRVRGGINQGYVTAGVGLNLLLVELEAAYYSREMGNYAGHRQNQAFVVGAKVKL